MNQQGRAGRSAACHMADINNMNGITEEEDKTCGLNDMNCVEEEEDKTCGLNDMNCLGE